ncbi:MAG: adenylate/guanylate cyclase domain-containing response regulator [Cellvibrionales bacterium]|jgi:adenylate cyclase|nr:adenylate/guanylate cyclase domain-containing response regulator [Cellvibrionales bacterium]
MSNVVPTRELVRLQGLQVKVGQLLVKNKLSDMLKDDLSRLYDALELSVAKLDDLNLQGIPLDSIDSAEMRHDIRNAIGITKGYAELIKDTAEAPSATLSNLLDKIMLWSAKTISTLERTRRKQTDSSPLAITSLKDQHPHHRGHILILDDEPANRELLSRHIQQLGLETFACATADEAYEVLRNNDIDLILLDLIMPGVSGHQVLADLKASQLWRAIPVIIISGMSDQDEVIKCIQAGADDYLQKPFNKVLLQARLHAGLNRKRWVDKERDLSNELEKSHRFIKNTFGRYLSTEIVSKLLDKPDGLDMGGQLQTVSILMADIRGFTTISESLPPQKVVKVLNNYLGTMADIIMAHDGTVDEFIGDAILALFGAPVAKADDSDRAIACALAMQAEMDAINERNIAEGLPSIRIGIGINTGEVVAGNIGSKKRAKYGVVGHAVNVTSRVEDQTQPGEILVAQSTLDHCSLTLQTGRELRLQPKGVKETISVTAINGIDSHGIDNHGTDDNQSKTDAEQIESNDSASNDTRPNNKLANE